MIRLLRLFGFSRSSIALSADISFCSVYTPSWMLLPRGLLCWAAMKASTLFTTPWRLSSWPIVEPPPPWGW
ncbi:hypothetical protein STENM327S_04993 [Streptomyces tendae]